MRPHRLRDFPYIGIQRYFLTICAFSRRRHFVNPALVEAVHAQFLRTSIESEFAVLAYCFMPDHVHLLVEGLCETSDLATFVATAKQRAAYAARAFVQGRLWQEGYFERVLRDEDDSFNVARYVINNPVRAGLVASPHEYPFLGSSVLTKDDLIGSCAWSSGG